MTGLGERRAQMLMKPTIRMIIFGPSAMGFGAGDHACGYALLSRDGLCTRILLSFSDLGCRLPLGDDNP